MINSNKVVAEDEALDQGVEEVHGDLLAEVEGAQTEAVVVHRTDQVVVVEQKD